MENDTSILFVALLLQASLTIPFWRIRRRAGLDPRWALLNLIPFAGFYVCLFSLARADWWPTPRTEGR